MWRAGVRPLNLYVAIIIRLAKPNQQTEKCRKRFLHVKLGLKRFVLSSLSQSALLIEIASLCKKVHNIQNAPTVKSFGLFFLL
jgi:hypothetical protein